MSTSKTSGQQLKKLQEVLKSTVTPELFRKEYARVFTENEAWNAIETTD